MEGVPERPHVTDAQPGKDRAEGKPEGAIPPPVGNPVPAGAMAMAVGKPKPAEGDTPEGMTAARVEDDIMLELVVERAASAMIDRYETIDNNYASETSECDAAAITAGQKSEWTSYKDKYEEGEGEGGWCERPDSPASR